MALGPGPTARARTTPPHLSRHGNCVFTETDNVAITQKGDRKTNEAKTEWASEYARRALRGWGRQHGLLEVSGEYVRQIEDDLRVQYDDPLKRAFVEALWDECTSPSAAPVEKSP
jgi:hypothetical protein